MVQNVLIISKMTRLEFNEFRYGNRVDNYYRRFQIDVDEIKENHDLHYKSLDSIVNCFRQNGIRPGIIMKQNLYSNDIAGYDLIVSVGGDGTFMDIAKYIKDDTPMFGIKSSPNSFGGHYNTNFSNAEEHIKRVLDGDYTIKPRTRVEASIINGETVSDCAANEVFLGDIYAPGYSKMDIIIEGEQVRSGSSGMVVSTFHGSTGWYNHIKIAEKDPEIIAAYQEAHRKAGLPEREVTNPDADFKPGEDDVVRYKIRETSDDRRSQGPDFGILEAGQEVHVISRMISDGRVSFDGSKPTTPRHRVYDFHFGNKAVIKKSDTPLYVVEFE